MISVLCLTRNAPQLASACLGSLLACAPTFHRAAGGAEFILADDASDESRATLPLLRAFRDAVAPAPVTVLRFRRQVQYAHGLACAMSLARGDAALFVSQDMVLPPDCLLELLAVAASDESIGVVRPTSQHMDWARALALAPPRPPASMAEVAAFAADVRGRFAGDATDWPMLIGDAMLIKRSAIDRIGVFDTRFYGYMADIDYGVRLRRAGLRHVIARGAWLHHEGAGTAKETAAAGGPTIPDYARRMLAEVQAAYDQFRRKWEGASLPDTFRDLRREHFDQLHALPPGEADAPQPPLPLEAADAEVL